MENTAEAGVPPLLRRACTLWAPGATHVEGLEADEPGRSLCPSSRALPCGRSRRVDVSSLGLHTASGPGNRTAGCQNPWNEHGALFGRSGQGQHGPFRHGPPFTAGASVTDMQESRRSGFRVGSLLCQKWEFLLALHERLRTQGMLFSVICLHTRLVNASKRLQTFVP